MHPLYQVLVESLGFSVYETCCVPRDCHTWTSGVWSWSLHLPWDPDLQILRAAGGLSYRDITLWNDTAPLRFYHEHMLNFVRCFCVSKNQDGMIAVR